MDPILHEIDNLSQAMADEFARMNRDAEHCKPFLKMAVKREIIEVFFSIAACFDRRAEKTLTKKGTASWHE